MIPLLLHCLRQLGPMLITVFIVLVAVMLVGLAATANPAKILTVFPFLSLLVWLTGFYLCLPALASDFLLPISRRTLFRAKISAVCLAVVLGLGIPFLVLNTIQAGELNMETVKRTVTFVSFLVAGVCLSTAFPTLHTFHVRGTLSLGKLFGSGCVIAPYLWLAYLISVRKSLGGFLLTTCLLLIAFVAYRKGSRLFSRYELVPQSFPAAMHTEKAGTKCVGSARTPEIPSEFVDTAGIPTAWHTRLLESMPASWRVPLLITWFRPLILSVLLVILPAALGAVAFAFQMGEPVPAMFFVIMAYLYRLGEGWGSILRALPGAYPRRQLFSAVTLPVLVATVWWSFLFGLWITPSTIALIATGFLGSLSFLLWLGIPPPPRHRRALRAHRMLLQASFVGLLLLFGLWVVADIYEDSFAARLVADVGSYISIRRVCEPSVSWPVSAICAFLAAVFWTGACRRFKYMEAVPPRGK